MDYITLLTRPNVTEDVLPLFSQYFRQDGAQQWFVPIKFRSMLDSDIGMDLLSILFDKSQQPRPRLHLHQRLRLEGQAPLMNEVKSFHRVLFANDAGDVNLARALGDHLDVDVPLS